ncbi:MAG TPA: cytidylate kinase-like family protein [Phycisphaerae bacterium]|nr:cytidylate kinase-like family protein [Phycisphaerae bacterium]
MTAPSSTPLSRLVERQMRNWELAKAQQVDSPVSREQVVHHFITISRQAGSGGGEVAALLGERLSWPVFDRNILQVMAEDDNVRRNLYESMDENDRNWVHEFAQSLFANELPLNDYFSRLSKTMLTVVRQGPAVILGRGGSLILPSDCGLRVRIIAPLEYRVTRLTSKSEVSTSRATAILRETDEKRDQFVRSHFNVDPQDQYQYDLIINMERTSPGAAADIIATASRARFK